MLTINNIFESPREFGRSFFDEISNKTLVIYGSGGGYHSFSQFVLSKKNILPEIFVDRKYSLTGENQYELHPNVFFEKYKVTEKNNIYILVTIGNRKIFNEIKIEFQQHGFTNIHSVLDVYEYNLCYAEEELANNIRSVYLNNTEDITTAYELLSDDQSKKIYLDIINGHFNRLPICFENYSYEDQYVVDGIGLRQNNISLLDCGAYDGDTLEKFISKYGGLDLAVALECDFKNFTKLSSKSFPLIKKLIALPLGSGEKNGQIYFNLGNEMLSRATNSPSAESSLISLIRCDEVFRGLDFNKIVIDTEGHEAPSLMGMANLIASQSPDIAVAAYHYPTDIYSLIILINTINSGYSFYLRNHSPFVVDTVLYAVKK